MELSSLTVPFILIAFNLFSITNTLAKQVYVTSPKVSSSLSIKEANGTINFPFISISETIYALEEGEPHTIYISPHEHSLDCLKCTNCIDKCELMRGKAQQQQGKQVTIQQFKKCQDNESYIEMCFNKLPNATISIFKNCTLLLVNDYLAMIDLTIKIQQYQIDYDQLQSSQNQQVSSLMLPNLSYLLQTPLLKTHNKAKAPDFISIKVPFSYKTHRQKT